MLEPAPPTNQQQQQITVSELDGEELHPEDEEARAADLARRSARARMMRSFKRAVSQIYSHVHNHASYKDML